MNRFAMLFIILALPFALSACGRAASGPTTMPTAMSAPADSGSVLPTAAPAALPTLPTSGMTEGGAVTTVGGQAFVDQAVSLSGKTVLLTKCNLMNTPGSDGHYACRVVDDAGADVKTADGLPVDVFFDGALLDQAAKDFIATDCADTFCNVMLAGTLTVSEATFYLSMTDVKLSKAN